MLSLMLVLTTVVASSVQDRQLPDTSGIEGELTEKLGVDQFFSLWLVFHNDEVRTSGEDYTILAPRNRTLPEQVLVQPSVVRDLVLDHIVLGQKVILEDVPDGYNFTTMGGKTVTVYKDNGTILANDATVLNPGVNVTEHGVLVVIEEYLFPDDLENLPPAQPSPLTEESSRFQTGSIETLVSPADESEESELKLSDDVDNLTFVGSAESDSPLPLARNTTDSGLSGNENSTFLENVHEVLNLLRSGVHNFNQHLAKSNVSEYLKEGEEYTVFVPTDMAFQRWHPIDWGFYPFAVDEFANSVIINHFVRGNIKQDAIKNGFRAKTVGGREVIFGQKPLSINGVNIVKGDTSVVHGNIMFVNEVLFVTYKIVERLNQLHKDKETAPLLSYPWFQSQFLSHTYLNLEERPEFSNVTYLMNYTDLAPYVTNAGYTFFVPTNDAFEQIALDKSLSKLVKSKKALEILLNHFVKGRLYEKDLSHGKELQTLGNKTIKITREDDKIRINDALVLTSNHFIYNLGTLFFIDHVLFVPDNLTEILAAFPEEEEVSVESTTVEDELDNIPAGTNENAERVPGEFAESEGSDSDLLLSGEDEKHTTGRSQQDASQEVATFSAEENANPQPDDVASTTESDEFPTTTQII